MAEAALGLPVSSDRKFHVLSPRLARFGDHGYDEEKQSLPAGRGVTEDTEDEELLPKEERSWKPKPRSSVASGFVWMVVNTLATIGIVFTNKAIFSDPSLKLAQLTFACFHFLVTYLTLLVLSRPGIALFAPRSVPLLDILPLSLAMSLNVILPNLSLAFSTVTFYQIARILLTPAVAILNYLLYRATLPQPAVLALVPACLGVGLVSYYDTRPPPGQGHGGHHHYHLRRQQQQQGIQATSPLGVVFALCGTLASALYTVWIAAYHRRLKLTSMQLLLNQAPVSAFLLLYVIPFLDTWPASWRALPLARWALVILSGAFASLINISQFFIVARAGPVSSTVVGHVKTCAIVSLGWLVSGRGVGEWGSLFGVIIAVGGIITYSVIMLKENEKKTDAKKTAMWKRNE